MSSHRCQEVKKAIITLLQPEVHEACQHERSAAFRTMRLWVSFDENLSPMSMERDTQTNV